MDLASSWLRQNEIAEIHYAAQHREAANNSELSRRNTLKYCSQIDLFEPIHRNPLSAA
jgi:hypothetical protein